MSEEPRDQLIESLVRVYAEIVLHLRRLPMPIELPAVGEDSQINVLIVSVFHAATIVTDQNLSKGVMDMTRNALMLWVSAIEMSALYDHTRGDRDYTVALFLVEHTEATLRVASNRLSADLEARPRRPKRRK